MMRLIDKMQLVDAVLKKRYSQASINLILNQPEVEAIPIEWIRQYIKGLRDAIELDSDYSAYCGVAEMLKCWEKENE